MLDFRGNYTALITPFAGGEIDKAALAELVEIQIKGGVDGLVPCGTTGEYSTMSHAEHIEVIRLVVRYADGRVPVLAGAGSNCTREAIELATAAKQVGADATLQITPYYNRPPQRGLVAHFLAIAEAVDLPMVLYNVPSRTACDMTPETVITVAAHPNICGIKEATGDLDRVRTIIDGCAAVRDAPFALLSGDDFTAFDFIKRGGHGVISVVANLVPELMTQLCALTTAGKTDEAEELNATQLPLTKLLFADSSPIPLKAALALLGQCREEIRAPLVTLEEDDPLRASLKAQLRDIGLLA